MLGWTLAKDGSGKFLLTAEVKSGIDLADYRHKGQMPV